MPLHESLRGRSLAAPPEPLPGPVADAHTHLDACGCENVDDVAAAMARARAVGVTKVVTVADDLESAVWAVQAANWHPDLYAAVALHPTRADRLDGTARAKIEELANDPRVVAIGETGLDHYWEAAPHDVQAEAFAWHIDLAKRTGKALMIHDRDAHDAVFEVLDHEGAPERVIFHCFSGDAAMARKCADAGYVMSFAGPVSFRNAVDLQAAAVLAPADLIMVETDAPFLTPHPHRGKRNEPFALPYTVRALALLRRQDVIGLCEEVNRTTERVYGIRVN
ncbi:TatD DNase family protein [Nakamurella sp. UYEF19]|uniref:TatD family hydrolase n=1 Tax=Nakamurella sp. UYEF19 TaxID=1756392 RepID=UPI003392491A